MSYLHGDDGAFLCSFLFQPGRKAHSLIAADCYPLDSVAW